MDAQELRTMLNAHQLWISSLRAEGQCINLRGADLRGAGLTGAGLTGANLHGATLPTGETWEVYLSEWFLPFDCWR